MKTYPTRWLLTLALLFTISPVGAQTFPTLTPIGQTPTSIKKLPAGKSLIGFQTGLLPNVEGLWGEIDQFAVNIEHGITRNHKLSISGSIRGGRPSLTNYHGEQVPLTQSIRASITQIITIRKNGPSILGIGTLQRSTTSDIIDQMTLRDKLGRAYGTATMLRNFQMYNGSGTIGITFPLNKTTLFATASIYKSYINSRTSVTSKQYNDLFQNSWQRSELEVQAGGEIGLMPNSSIMLVTTISNEGTGVLLNYNIILN